MSFCDWEIGSAPRRREHIKDRFARVGRKCDKQAGHLVHQFELTSLHRPFLPIVRPPANAPTPNPLPREGRAF